MGKPFEPPCWANMSCLPTADAENIQAINTDEFSKFGVEPIRRLVNNGWVGDGFFVTDGAAWKQSRKLVMPIFARAQIADLSNFAVHVDRLLGLVPRTGGTVDLQPLFRRLFLDSSTEFLFGESSDSLLSQSDRLDVEHFLKAFDKALLGVDRRTILRGMPFLYGRATQDIEWRQACAEVHRIVDGYIDRAFVKEFKYASEKSSRDNCHTPGSVSSVPLSILHELIKETQDRRFIRDQIISVFFPARDASAIGISDIFFHLARSPDVWTKLREEALRANEPLSFESLKSLKYLQSVLNESLRLLSPASMSQRTCLEDCVLPRGGGPSGISPILVPKGTQIDINFGILQRDQDFWGLDAEEFRPYRWRTIRPRWEYIPFLGGGRICPAQQMVLNQLGYMLVRFVREFETIENRDTEIAFVEDYKFSMQSRNGIKVAFPSLVEK